MRDNAVAHLFYDESLLEQPVFSDVTRPVQSPWSNINTTLPLSEAPEDRPGINASSPWLLQTQRVRFQHRFVLGDA